MGVTRFFTLVLAILLNFGQADVTVLPAGFNLPLPYSVSKPVTSSSQLLAQAAPYELPFDKNTGGSTDVADIVISSFSGLNKSSTFHATSDGFVRGAIEAWGQHQHLVIRPEEVWFTILVQLNYWMNAHADDPDVRPIFVNTPAGTKTEIHVDGNNWYDAIRKFRQAIQDHVKVPWFKDWITPNWSTSTESDSMTANVLMMGLTQKYFTFSASIICGLPSVTLLGTREDWVSLQSRLDRLKEFGAGPARYAQQLRPITSRFITSFESPQSRRTREFWASIVHAKPGRPGMCGVPAIPYYITGWITGFLYWNFDGTPLVDEAEWNPRPSTGPRKTPPILPRQGLIGDETDGAVSAETQDYVASLDGISYPTLPITGFPVSYAKVPLKLEQQPAYALAGLIATDIAVGPPVGYASALAALNLTLPASITAQQQNTYQPVSGWMIYLDDSAGAPEVPPGTGGFKGPTSKGYGPPKSANQKPKITSQEVMRLANAIAMDPKQGTCEKPSWFSPRMRV